MKMAIFFLVWIGVAVVLFFIVMAKCRAKCRERKRQQSLKNQVLGQIPDIEEERIASLEALYIIAARMQDRSGTLKVNSESMKLSLRCQDMLKDADNLIQKGKPDAAYEKLLEAIEVNELTTKNV